MLDHLTNDALNSCVLDLLSFAFEVLVNSLEPPDVIMTVWNQMHVQLLVPLLEVALQVLVKVFIVLMPFIPRQIYILSS